MIAATVTTPSLDLPTWRGLGPLQRIRLRQGLTSYFELTIGRAVRSEVQQRIYQALLPKGTPRRMEGMVQLLASAPQVRPHLDLSDAAALDARVAQQTAGLARLRERFATEQALAGRLLTEFLAAGVLAQTSEGRISRGSNWPPR